MYRRKYREDFEPPELEQIARSARGLVQREFTYEKTVERYRSVVAFLTK